LNLFQGPRVHFQLDAGDVEQQISETVTPPVKASFPTGMKPPLKSYSTTEIKTAIGLSNDVNRTQAVSIVCLGQVSQISVLPRSTVVRSWLTFQECILYHN
jgi:hypothetical protein